ncbi:hypothetical protein FVER53590_28356 [Fusarium verticillioides]|nr:hypothetical protein FVER53590_28356 [Fusarium verticillioides]
METRSVTAGGKVRSTYSPNLSGTYLSTHHLLRIHPSSSPPPTHSRLSSCCQELEFVPSIQAFTSCRLTICLFIAAFPNHVPWLSASSSTLLLGKHCPAVPSPIAIAIRLIHCPLPNRSN